MRIDQFSSRRWTPDHRLEGHELDDLTGKTYLTSARKAMLWWVINAAKEETRARRVETIVTKAARGERAQG